MSQTKKTNKKKKELDFDSVLTNVMEGIKAEKCYEIPKSLNIVDFAEKHLGQKLRSAQKSMLKCFYAGSRYNENIDIDDNDIDEIKSWSIDNDWIFEGEKPKIENLKNKENRIPANQLVLVIGRRSGKSFITSLIAAYEVYKLLCLGDPQGFYGIENDIYIINVAVTADQAKKEIFSTIRRFIYKSSVMSSRISKDIENEMRILTNKDIEQNIKNKENGLKEIDGSIVILSGSSNADAIRGHSAIIIIYDEFAHFVDTSTGESTAESTYIALSPSTKTFLIKGDGRNVIISSPLNRGSFFFKHFERSKTMIKRQVFQIPTWDAAKEVYSFDDFAEDFAENPMKASAEYGAQFIGAAGNPYFPADRVDRAFENSDRYIKTQGEWGYRYYMYIDWAKSSDNWAVLIGHPEWRIDSQGNKVLWLVEDYSRFWVPPQGKVIDPDDIMDNHIFPLFEKFRIEFVGFDGMMSTEQEKKFLQRSINYKNVSFQGQNKLKMYETLRNFIVSGRIELCKDDHQLCGELKNITIEYTKRGPRIDKNKNSEYPTDDLVDCLAAISEAISQGPTGRTTLPRSVLVRTGMR